MNLEKAINHGGHGDTAEKQELARCACFILRVICSPDQKSLSLRRVAVLAVVKNRFSA
jgi:hypothetical protein